MICELCQITEAESIYYLYREELFSLCITCASDLDAYRAYCLWPHRLNPYLNAGISGWFGGNIAAQQGRLVNGQYTLNPASIHAGPRL